MIWGAFVRLRPAVLVPLASYPLVHRLDADVETFIDPAVEFFKTPMLFLVLFGGLTNDVGQGEQILRQLRLTGGEASDILA